MKRAAIFFFYDTKGIADRYVDYFLRDLSENLQRLVIVSNGPITPETRDMFRQYTKEILVRENRGFDVWAYKAAMEYMGWEAMAAFDELILTNSTLMGPVYPFAEMFGAMAQRNVDFWGITKYGMYPEDPFHSNPYGYVPEHIQSHFMVYRKRFMEKADLRKYWEEMPMIRSYDEAVGRHEAYFTKFFEDKGYRWEVYADTREDDHLHINLVIIEPLLLIQKYRCPIFKRRSFFQPRDYYLHASAGEAPARLMEYLREETSYDTDMIWETLLRSCHQNDVAEALSLIYLLPAKELLAGRQAGTPPLKVALCMHLYFMDLLDDSLACAQAMPGDADIYITTVSEDHRQRVLEAFQGLPNRVEVRVIENRGRDVSSLLVGLADVNPRYDLICFFHDKKSEQVYPHSAGRSFGYKENENVLGSRAFVQNVIQTFAENPRLGLLSPTEPNHAEYYISFGGEWGPNYDNAKKLAEDLGLDAPMSPEKPPVAPLGTTFWYRAKALQKLFDKGWKYTDFPKEPNNTDATILHAIERLYPYVAQDAGFYPAYVLSDRFGAMELTNLRRYLRNFAAHFQKKTIYGPQYAILAADESRTAQLRHQVAALEEELVRKDSLKYLLRIRLREFLPRPVYGGIVRTKRALFGPRGVPYTYDD